jgi:hypothetical protein
VDPGQAGRVARSAPSDRQLHRRSVRLVVPGVRAPMN